MHRCPDCWFTGDTIHDLYAHHERVERLCSDAVADLFWRILRYADGTDIVDDAMHAALSSDNGYAYHGYVVWLRHAPTAIVVWEGNNIDPDMNRIVEIGV